MTLRKFSLAVCTLVLTGCPLIKTSTSTTTPSSSPSSAETTDTNGNKVPNLIGLSIDAAKQTIKKHGFDGQIDVLELSTFDKDCKPETVCQVQSTYWYLNQDHQVTLFKNQAISIAVPE